MKTKVAITLFLMAFLLVLVACSNDETPTGRGTGSFTTRTPDSEEGVSASESVPQWDNSGAEQTTLSVGIHVIGEDIPAGRYFVTSPDGELDFTLDRRHSIYYQGTGVPNAVVYLTEEDNIMTGRDLIFTPNDNWQLSNTLGSGMWIVGLDISAGTYKVRALNNHEFGFISVYPMRSLPIVAIAPKLIGSEFDDPLFRGETEIELTLTNGDFVSISGTLSSVIFE